MSWQDYALARQYLVEHRIGTRVRQAKAEEDDEAAETRKHMERLDGSG